MLGTIIMNKLTSNDITFSIGMKVVLFVFSLISMHLSAQHCRLCDAVEKNNFKRVEKIVRNKLLERKNGDQINNGNAIYTTYNVVYDELVEWLVQKECVELAAWDKCQIKILPYPSYATIGAIFKTENKQMEMIFRIREGHSNKLKQRVNARERLYYLGMKEGNGFVRNQISICDLAKKPRATHDSLSHHNSREDVKAVEPYIQKFNDKIDYKKILGQYVNIGYNDTLLFKELGNPPVSVIMTRSSRDTETYGFPIVTEGKIKQIGHYSPWHIQIVGIQILPNGDLEVHFSGSYAFEEKATTKLTYRKIVTE